MRRVRRDPKSGEHVAGLAGDPDAVLELQRCAQRAPHGGVGIHDQHSDRFVHSNSRTALERAGQEKGARSETTAKRLTAA